MATRQQQKGTGLENQYEDLVPKSQWIDQPEATLLTIDLPGFAREQIKVTYIHNSKMIRVTGERPVANQRWIRFNEVFTVPQNCQADNIHGSFKNNVLTITMPKETITKTDSIQEDSKVEEKRLLEEAKRKEKLEEAEQKKKKQLLEERKLQEEAKAKEKAEMMRKFGEEAKVKEKAEMMRKLGEEAKAKEKAQMMRKVEEEAKAKEKAEMKKVQEEAKAKETAEMMRKLVEEAKAKEKPNERKLVEEAKLKERKYVDEFGGKEKRKLPEVVYEVAKSAEENLGYLLEKEEIIGKGGIMEKIKGKEITSEEKKLMLNVGVAALVIFALGAYVSYNFSSSSSSSTKPE